MRRVRKVADRILGGYIGSAAFGPKGSPRGPRPTAEGSTVSAVPEPSLQHAVEQPVLLRAIELGPPPDDGVAHGWRSPLLAGLPSLQPLPAVPVHAPPRPAPRAPRALITEAEARGLAGAAARAVLDVLEGRRPLGQLRAVFAEQAISAVHAMSRGGLRWPVRRATIGAVRVYLPSHDAVEAFAVFHCDHRARALALRFD